MPFWPTPETGRAALVTHLAVSHTARTRRSTPRVRRVPSAPEPVEDRARSVGDDGVDVQAGAEVDIGGLVHGPDVEPVAGLFQALDVCRVAAHDAQRGAGDPD